MAKRGENIYKRKDGRWEGRILKKDGKYQYFYAQTYKETKEKMRLFLEGKKYHEMKQAIRGQDAAGLFQNWINGEVMFRVKPSTYESYYYCINKHIIPFFNLERNKRMTEATILRFMQELKENQELALSSKKKICMILKIALKDILKEKSNCLALIALIKLPVVQVKEVPIFSIKEQRIIERAVLKFGDSRAIGILFCFYTGLRLGELCALKWSDIDIDSATMSITKTVARVKDFSVTNGKSKLMVGSPKSSKSVRRIPLPEFLLDMLKEIRKSVMYKDFYIFSGNDEPIDPRTYQNFYRKILEKSDLPVRKFHAIRHTFATRALELGIDVKTLSEILGHSNVSITLNIYAHSLMEHKKTAIEKFNLLYKKTV